MDLDGMGGTMTGLIWLRIGSSESDSKLWAAEKEGNF
jgi:hypothetical protein